MSRKSSGFDRKSSPKKLGNKIIIGCEDKATSPNYFKAIRVSLRVGKERIDAFHPDCTDPLGIVQAVIDRRDELKKEKAWDKEDSAWAVFDGDEHEINNPKNRLSAIKLARNKNIQLVIINPSFELWYLLHFQDYFGTIHRHDALRLLKGHINDYDKAVCYYISHLQPLTIKAIDRAEKIQQQIERDGLDQYSNPCCSKLPELVNKLLEMKLNY